VHRRFALELIAPCATPTNGFEGYVDKRRVVGPLPRQQHPGSRPIRKVDLGEL
jgi:hypothetical protein